jgi:hypothetical protein
MSKNMKQTKQQKQNPLYKMDYSKICNVILSTPKPKKKKNQGL